MTFFSYIVAVFSSQCCRCGSYKIDIYHPNWAMSWLSSFITRSPNAISGRRLVKYLFTQWITALTELPLILDCIAFRRRSESINLYKNAFVKRIFLGAYIYCVNLLSCFLVGWSVGISCFTSFYDCLSFFLSRCHASYHFFSRQLGTSSNNIEHQRLFLTCAKALLYLSSPFVGPSRKFYDPLGASIGLFGPVSCSPIKGIGPLRPPWLAYTIPGKLCWLG